MVEASIDWVRGTTGQSQTITLSTTSEYFSDEPNPPIVGATVSITKDDEGTEFLFVDQGDGNYTTNEFIPEIGQAYTLQIEVNGEIYIAHETMTPVSNISHVEQSTDDGFSNEDIEITLYYDDIAGEDNYYMAEFFPSHKPLPTLWVFTDQFTDGNESTFFYEDEDFEPGVTVDINLLGISEQYYYFMNIIVTQSSQNITGPFIPAPVEANGNINNINNPDEEVLGYFRLCEAVNTVFIIE